MTAVTHSGSALVATALDADVQSYIHFPEGLVGCSTWKRFVLLSPDDADLPVGVLCCLDEPGISLMVTDPALVLPGYTAPLTQAQREELELASDQPAVLYCTLTIGRDGEITANLLGPLAINTRTRRGKQLVLSETTYSARHPVGVVEA